jgi:uncharacterized paraquat-inducible protein A
LKEKIGVHMILKCPKCDKEIKDEESAYCPFCRIQIGQTGFKKTAFPVAGGCLTIFTACLCAFLGILGILGVAAFSSFYVSPGTVFSVSIMGVFGIIAFAVGLAGGMMSIRRKRFELAVVGPVFVLFYSSVNTNLF